MIPEYDKVHLKFKLNSVRYSNEDIQEIAYSFVKEGLPYQREIGDFLIDWLDKKDYVKVKTSGATGRPKQIKILKQTMVNSSIFTGNFFNLSPGDKALHCLPANFIAGKMMLVRAMILGLELDLIEPLTHPVFDANKSYDFCAMIPIQLQNSVGKIDNIKNIIVGGMKVSSTLIEAIKGIPVNIYETYGMTETVTHVALKSLNTTVDNKKSYFQTLPNVSVYKDDRDCLVIKAPHLSKNDIITNDIVELYSDTEFEWLGRFDNVINSGGLKVFPERIEEKLESKVTQRFFIASEPDEILGVRVVMVVEGNSNNLDPSIFDVLDKYEKPKHIYSVNKFVETSTGKIQRDKTLNKINL